MVDNEAALFALNDNPDARFWKLDFDSLTWAERVFRAIWSLEGEVNNGGFDQFFFNSSGDIAYFVPEALDAIGAHKVAEIVREANALFPPPHPAIDRDARQLQLDALDDFAKEHLNQLDEEFFGYPDNLTNLLYAFVTSHRNQIVGA